MLQLPVLVSTCEWLHLVAINVILFTGTKWEPNLKVQESLNVQILTFHFSSQDTQDTQNDLKCVEGQ